MLVAESMPRITVSKIVRNFSFLKVEFSTSLLLWLGLGTETNLAQAQGKIMFWHKLPDLVATNTSRSVSTSCQKYPLSVTTNKDIVPGRNIQYDSQVMII